MVSVQNVSKRYTGNGRCVDALRNVRVAVAPGEFVSIVGPSGSGKSTFLLTIGGLITPSYGKVVIDGVDLYGMSTSDRAVFRMRHIGFIFQTFNLIPYLNSVENVQVPLLLSGVEPRRQRTIAERILDELGMQDRLFHRPAELSVGEKQRVALARALANSPRVILADEPTGNLDPDRSEEILRSLKCLSREGRTVIVVTHDNRVAETADRCLSIVDGFLSERLPEGKRVANG